MNSSLFLIRKTPFHAEPAHKDFEEMVWRQGRKHCGLFRIENLPRQERLILLRETLKYYAKELDRGAIVIALTQKFRIRHPR